MRRSSVVTLTLLPMLAAAAIASADVPVTIDPSETPPVLEPPGMTPTIMELDCDDDPNWRLRPDCSDDDDVYWYDGGVIRGGFGTYFYGGGGG